MFDFLAPLFGRVVVYVEDPIGRFRKLWAQPSPFGNRLVARLDLRPLILEPDGSVNRFGSAMRWMYKADAKWNTSVPQWQPIETAPKDGTIIIGLFSHIGCVKAPCVRVISWNYDLEYWEIHVGRGCGVTNFTPTHWTPIPEPTGVPAND